MLLHNQRGSSISWEANGKVYSWEPYGACELPDEFVSHIKSEGFPVDSAPVPPREKAERAAALMTESEAAVELEAARKALRAAEERAREAKAAAEAADIRAADVRKEADETKKKLGAVEEENRTLRSDAAAYEKLLAETSAELGKMREQAKVAAEQAKLPAQSSKSKDK